MAAAVITAVATMITAVGGIVLAISVLIPTLRETRKVHTIVNQQHTDLKQYQKALVQALQNAHVDVPEDQSTLQ